MFVAWRRDQETGRRKLNERPTYGAAAANEEDGNADGTVGSRKHCSSESVPPAGQQARVPASNLVDMTTAPDRVGEHALQRITTLSE